MASREIRRASERLEGKQREKKEKSTLNPIAIPSIIVILLVLVGLLYFGQGEMRDTGTIVFGYYDGRPIVWAEGNYYGQKIGEVSQENKDIPYPMIAELLLPYMRFHTAVLVEAERNGLFVADAEVEDYIKSMGEGALKRYNEQPTERYRIFAFAKEELIEQKFVRALVRSVDNRALADAVAQMGSPEKSFRFVEWKYEDYPVQEIARFADENKNLFRSIKLSRITAKAENEARDAAARIKSGQSTFAEQFKTLSKIEDEAAAALDWQSFHSLAGALGSRETAEKIFSLRQGEISDVVALGSDWLIYRCDQEAVPADLSAEKTMAEVKSYIIDNQKGRVETYFETKAREFLAQAAGKSLAAAAAAAKLTAHESGFFPFNYSSLPFLKRIPAPTGQAASLESAQSSDAFFKEVFPLKPGSLSTPILLTDKVIVCEVSAERAVDPVELENAKTGFTSFRLEDFANFRAVISQHFYTRGTPQFITGQPIPPAAFEDPNLLGQLQQYQSMINFNFSQSVSAINQSPVYLALMDPIKAGTPGEQAAWKEKGLEQFRKYFGTQAK